MKIRLSLATLAVLVLAACAPAATPPPAEDTPTSIPIELPTATASPEATPDPEASPDPEPSGEVEVEIEDFIFNPPMLTITAGTTVKWTNKDNSAHTVAGDDGSWRSSRLNRGSTFTFTFTQPGTYTYFCSLHPAMTGTIIVISP